MARSRPRSRWAFRLLLAVLAAIALWGAWEAVTWPDVARLAREQPKTTAFIDEYRARQRILGKPGRVAWTWSPYAAISPDIKRAVLVAEDINFFSHRGFELAELQNALEEALRDRELPRGASTISQQLAKNLWLSPSRNPWRKAKEAILTWQMERALPKRRILELYLNVVELEPRGLAPGSRVARVPPPDRLHPRAHDPRSLPRPSALTPLPFGQDARPRGLRCRAPDG